MNRNYIRSRTREIMIKNIFEKDGWLSTRTPQSRGIADVWAIRPPSCGHCTCPENYEVKLIQVKVSEKIKKGSIIYTSKETNTGIYNIEIWRFPVRKKKK